VFVGVDLPAHRERALRHAAETVLGQRLLGQPGPQDEAAVVRVAGGDAEGEGVGAQPARGQAPRGLGGGVGVRVRGAGGDGRGGACR
jgi:hypothetical protein